MNTDKQIVNKAWPALLAVALTCGISAAAYAQMRDFNNPASNDTSQQFAADNVQREDTPNDPEYDRVEPDDEDGGASATSLFEERFDLFGFPASSTRNTAIYLQGPNQGQPQVSGFNAAGAWKLTRGRADVVVAVLDTGIRWNNRNIRTKVFLNTGELPLPQNAAGETDPDAPLGGYDLNGNGYVDVDDYIDDARVTDFAAGDGAGILDGEDLIMAFSDGSDADGNGFVDDISGWDFFNDDNNAFDQSSYFAARNHGTGRMEEAAEIANDGRGELGVCPNCTVMPLRIWDTFVADANTFGMGVLYAADNGVSVIVGADGALGHTAFMEAASQYAYEQGLVQVYSGNDLNTGNHNYPANYSHAMLIEGVVTDAEGLGMDSGDDAGAQLFPSVGLGTQVPVGTYFRSANTAQFGGKSSISMEGPTGSTNTGKAGGAAGMVISAARDAGVQLTPDETRIILEQTVEDVLPGNTGGTGNPDPAQEGWDIHFGYGRTNLGDAVSLAASGDIPPQAALFAPDWYAPLADDTVNITGQAQARFAPGGNFTWRLEWGVGLAPTEYNLVNEGSSSDVVTEFGEIDLTAVRAALAAAVIPPDTAGPTFSPTAPGPFEQQFTVRLTVQGEGLPVAGVDRRVLTALDDDSLRAGFPIRLGTGGEAPLRYADLDGDNVEELIVPGMDGLLRILNSDGSDFPGFPVQTQLMFQALEHLDAPGFAALVAQGAPPREELRGTAVADLDDDGIPELINAAGVRVYVWQNDGSLRPGFPVSLDMENCAPDEQRQSDIHRKCGFIGSPGVGRLEGPDEPPVIVVAGLEGHLYAFRPDGSALNGFPVNLVDPDAANPVLAESINSPAIGDLNGDGFDDVVIATNETYPAENPSPEGATGGSGSVIGAALAQAAGSSSRVYAVSGANGAFLPGWPITLNGAVQETLPLVGPGHDAALASINGTQSVVVSTTGGDLAVYDVDGALINTMQQGTFGPASNATDQSGQFNLFESASLGDLTGAGTLNAVKYGLTLNGLANLLLVGQNMPYNHLIGAYDLSTGSPLPAYPTITDDFQFLSASNIGKVADGPSNQIIAGTGLGLVHAYDGVTGQDVAGFPKVTGGWLFAPPELSRDGRIAAISREGFLFEWDIPAFACQSEWPTFRHDPHSTGNYDADGTPPGSVRELTVNRDAAEVTLSWLAPGDDGLCGAETATAYRITADGQRLDADAGPQPAAAGSMQSFAPAAEVSTVTVQAVDEAGNVGFPMTAQIDGGDDGGSDDGGDGGDGGNGGNGGDDDGGTGGGDSGGTDGGGPAGNAGAGGSGGSSGGCVLNDSGNRFDPVWLMLLLLGAYGLSRRRQV